MTTKNIFLYQTNGQSLAALRHANGRDFWVISVEAETNRFLAYLVDPGGLRTIPVISNVPYKFIYGRLLRSSPDGRLIATNTYTGLPGSPECTIFDFDPATGRITNTRLIISGNGYGGIMDFSPDGQKVYWQMPDQNAVSYVAQFDLSKGNPEAIAASRYDIPVTRGKRIGDIRLGPDGRVYVLHAAGAIDAIENPTEEAGRLQYRQLAFVFNTYVFWLPNNLHGFPQGKSLDFTAQPQCSTGPVQFESNAGYLVKEWQWNFGDPASGEANTSTERRPAHTFSGPGSYMVELVATDRCGEKDTLRKPVVIYPDPIVDIPEANVKKCFSEVPVTFSVPAHPFTQYRWNTGDTTSRIEARRTGWYRVEASNPCGSSRDSVYLEVTPEATAYLPDDTIVCEGNFARLDALNEGAAYRWSTGETSRTIGVDKPGTYWVEIRNECSATVDTTRLVFIREDVSAFIPNVFTPNSDGYNDTFRLLVLNTPAFSLTIVNRWGKRVFSSRNPFASWEGRVNGSEEAAPGIYFWWVTATDCRGAPITYKGYVSLLR